MMFRFNDFIEKLVEIGTCYSQHLAVQFAVELANLTYEFDQILAIKMFAKYEKYAKFVKVYPLGSHVPELFDDLAAVKRELMTKNPYGLHKCSICPQKGVNMCSRCKKSLYCSRECQQSAWKKHKNVCVNKI